MNLALFIPVYKNLISSRLPADIWKKFYNIKFGLLSV